MDKWDEYKKLVLKFRDHDDALIDRSVAALGERVDSDSPRIINSEGDTENDLIITSLKTIVRALTIKIDAEITDPDYYDEVFFLEYKSISHTLNPGMKIAHKTAGIMMSNIGWDGEFEVCDGKLAYLPALLAWYYYRSEHIVKLEGNFPEAAEPARQWHENQLEKVGIEAGFNLVHPHRIIESEEDISTFIEEVKAKRQSDLEAVIKPPPLTPDHPIGGIPISGKPSASQPILHTPKADGNISHRFTSRALEVIGREEEEKKLMHFVDDVPGFRWTQVSGDGGQGKSRLALNLLDSLGENWNKGFIHSPELKAFNDKWRQWRPDRPTLIVIDYVLSDIRNLANLFYYLSVRNKKLLHPVRVLVVERENWKLSATEPFYDPTEQRKREPQRPPYAFSKWYEDIVGREIDLISSHCNSVDNIHLGGLNQTQLLKICKKWLSLISKSDKHLASTAIVTDEIISTTLSRIDHSGRPLYAYFLAEALEFQADVYGWRTSDLLKFTLKREIQHRWEYIFDGPPPDLEESHPALEIAALTTMLGGLDLSRLDDLRDWSFTESKIRRQVMAIVGQEVSSGIPTKHLSALRPHLLGDWFVLESMKENKLFASRLLLTGWALEPQKMGEFGGRILQDYADHTSTERFLVTLPQGDDHEHWSNFMNFYCDKINQSMFKKLFNLDSEKKVDDDIRLMSTLCECLFTIASRHHFHQSVKITLSQTVNLLANFCSRWSGHDSASNLPFVMKAFDFLSDALSQRNDIIASRKLYETISEWLARDDIRLNWTLFADFSNGVLSHAVCLRTNGCAEEAVMVVGKLKKMIATIRYQPKSPFETAIFTIVSSTPLLCNADVKKCVRTPKLVPDYRHYSYIEKSREKRSLSKKERTQLFTHKDSRRSVDLDCPIFAHNCPWWNDVNLYQVVRNRERDFEEYFIGHPGGIFPLLDSGSAMKSLHSLHVSNLSAWSALEFVRFYLKFYHPHESTTDFCLIGDIQSFDPLNNRNDADFNKIKRNLSAQNWIRRNSRFGWDISTTAIGGKFLYLFHLEVHSGMVFEIAPRQKIMELKDRYLAPQKRWSTLYF